MLDSTRLLVLTDASALDWEQFFALYRESSLENAVDWYPDLPEEAALQKYEAGYREHLLGAFREEHGILLLLEKEGVYLSALRLYPQEQNLFFLEALETHPKYRQMGYGKRILQEMMLYLHQNHPGCTVWSSVSRKNRISISTHRAAGFDAEPDQEGKHLKMVWDDSQLARISAYEVLLNHVLTAEHPSDVDLRALAEYYECPLWRKDYEDDEAGRIPPSFKRGVLSEDAIYDVLSGAKEGAR